RPVSKPFSLTVPSAPLSTLYPLLAPSPHPDHFPPMYEEIDPETGIQESYRDPTPRYDVYPINIIFDQDEIQGSCLYFNERVCITAEIRNSDFQPTCTLDEAVARWGEKLVIVASQMMRHRALIGWENDIELKLPDYSYCILERLGRARWQGELQRDLHSGAFKIDARKMHYHRRVLDRNDLITLQAHVIRQANGNQQYSILLLLKRFHVDRRSKYDILMEKISNILTGRPNQIDILQNLRDELGLCERTFKKLYQYLVAAGLAKIVSIPLQELHPDSGPRVTKKGTQIIVRCLKLLKAYRKKVEEEDDDDEDSASKAVESVDVVYERDMLTQAYELVEKSGTRGISQSAIRMALNVGKLEGRMLCRLLERYKVVTGFMEDEGRQRTTKYVARPFVAQSELSKQFEKEKARHEWLATASLTSPEPTEEEHCPPSGGEEPGEDVTDYVHEDLPEETPAEAAADQSDPVPSPPSVMTHACLCHLFSQERECGSKIKKLCRPRLKRPHETCRLLKRKNMIIEAVRSLKLIESLFSLQKMIMDQEKLDGIGTRCCKKSIIRMVQTLSQEGFLRLYRTTVIQDGIKKKVELVVHPSIFPTDPLVKSAIEQVRFRISSSYTAHRLVLAAAEMEANKGSETPSKPSTKRTEEKMGVTPLKNYHPVIVPGLGRSLGFLPKMPRLRLVHTFLWYVVYGHPLRKPPAEALNSETILSESNLGTGAETLAPNADSEGTQWNCEIEPLFVNKTVYADEATWKRYTPATPIHKEFGQGWALVSDVLLCLPLSIFIQIVQVSHKVDNMEEYINDQMKKFSLVKHLPQPMRQQLLYKRRYIFSFFESLQRLCYMGLLQFGPTEKFQEKDQVFISIKRNATIVDTTSCDPHYNMARSNRPFDKRRYTFNRFQDVESFWFDLMCVCLNTPLGVIRFPRQNKKSGQATQAGAEERVPNSVMDQETAAGRHTLERRCAMLEYTTGSRSLVDDGIIPGDGLGAAGLDSSFFGHLKRNWIWTSYIISNAKKSSTLSHTGLMALPLPLFVLLLMKMFWFGLGNALNMLGAAEEPLARRAEDIRMEKEPNMGRNKRVGGGKGMKRKSPEKDSVRRPRKRKRRRKDESSEQQKAKRFRFHDDADKSALCRMTKLRVTWTAQEDSLLMLCRVASHVLNKKVKGPFVPWQAVRDVLHAHFEEALDKTSLAVGRRSRYILRNPQTMLNYRICLAEVYQDHDLIEEFMNKSGDYQDFHVCSAEFKVFVGRLREKFSSTIGSGNIDIPDTLQELFARYKILVIGEEEDEEQKQDEFLSIDDIHYVVLQNLIQSTLTLSDTQMKSCQSFQTFHLYKQYNDDVLVKVFVEFQEKSLINRRRVSKSLGPKKSRALPFAPMSYQLSQTYFRNFVWRFPNYICSETYHFVEKLKSAGTADIPNTFSFPGKETLMETNMVTYPLDGNGGYCVATISLFVLGLLSFSVSIPEQIVVVDSTLVDNEVIKRLGKEGLDDYDDEDLDETGSKPRIEVKAPQASHTNYLLMRGYYAPGIVNTRNLNPNDNIVVNSCQGNVRESVIPHYLAVLYKSASGEHEVPQSFTKVVRPSTETYGVEKVKKHLMEELGYSPEDLVAVQEISNRIKDSAVFGIGQTELAKAFAHYEETQDERMKTLKQYLQDLMALDQIVAVGGYTNRFVATIHAHPWLLHPLEVKRLNEDLALPSSVELVSEQSIFSRPRANGSESSTENNVLESTEQFEGSRESVKADPNTEIALDERDGLQANTAEAENVPLSCSPVSIENAKRNSEDIGCELDNCGHPSKRSRLTDEASESRHDEQISFVCHPWRIVDGSLNKPVLKGMIEAVLYHIMTKPGITEQKLLSYYHSVLQPVAVLELLQGLEDLRCIRRRCLAKSKPASLFSAPTSATEVEDPKLSDSCTVFYEPTIDCVLRLSKLFPHEPNWNKWIQ
uniref:Ral transcription factor IIIC subunit 1 n=1 Tax=Callorhinchus milii TaxID=7868 RepID=A0A4W3HJJ2_CALMI